MKDTIIKGTGNSRSIKAPANLKQQVTDLDSLLDMLIAGFPCDIGPLNEAGCQQIGDALNKENLLKDDTAALYGLTGEAVPDEVLAAIRPLITTAGNSGLHFLTGTYGGTGETTGQKTINCPGIDPYVFVLTTVGNGPGCLAVVIRPSKHSYMVSIDASSGNSNLKSYQIYLEWAQNSVTCNLGYYTNASSTTYAWLILGKKL